MLEDLDRTPEEKRTTQMIVHTGVAAFALYAFVEMVAGMGAPVMLGAATALAGTGYAHWLRKRWKEEAPTA